MKILVIFGVNMDMLGKRETNLYGEKSLDEIVGDLKKKYEVSDIEPEFFQSNIEGEICTKIGHTDADAIVINAGAYTHYSIAIRDAIKGCNKKVVEVHQTNLFAREEFRKTSVIAPVCYGTICGFGEKVYKCAVECLRV